MFTRPWVVDFILDLLDYRPERDLATLRLVEPSCGAGAFLEPIVRRIGTSCRSYGRDITEAIEAVLAFDLLDHNVMAARDRVTSALIIDGWDAEPARRLANSWIRQGDYLLEVHDAPIDVVVGNPPYIRLEDVPEHRMRAYRDACPTMIGRADLYVGFFETALGTLAPRGRLGFICADRWMRNQYGRALRKLVTSRYSVDAVIGMHGVDAFDAQVCAYPAVIIIGNAQQQQAIAATASQEFDAVSAQQLVTWMRTGTADSVVGDGFGATRLPHWFTGDDLWPETSPERLSMLEDLTGRFTTLGDPGSGVRVGIGVATGADAVFITNTSDLPIEPDRLLPLAMVRDTKDGQLRWSGHYLVNPWDDEGNLVDLDRYPRLAAYLGRHETRLRARHVGRRQPNRWYRTIDKVDATLTKQPKLLFADLKLTSEPVLDPGGHYPHHNLYFLTSDLWDLRVLGGLLLSKVAEAFIDAYAVKMSGGTLRFQAQYLRRIPIPALDSITDIDREALIDAFERRDAVVATKTALRAYGLDTLPS